MPSLFNHYPDNPNRNECNFAYLILARCHTTPLAHFLNIFQTTKAARNARGAATDEEQDLLRAMLGFASAGLD